MAKFDQRAQKSNAGGSPAIKSAMTSPTGTKANSQLLTPHISPKRGALTRNGRGGACCQKKTHRDLPGGPVSRTSCFQYKGLGFNPWSTTEDPAGPAGQPKKKEKKMQKQETSMLVFRLAALVSFLMHGKEIRL